MNNVLIVDDETDFLLSLQEGLNHRPNDYNVFTAENGAKALEMLESISIHLVITDLKMPKMDGFELVTQMHQTQKDIPVIVMTAFNTPEIEKRIGKSVDVSLLEKPLSISQIDEKITEVLSETSRGHLQGITLPSFIQLLEMEKKTCSLTVKTKNKKGVISFLKGVLTDAETGGVRGDEAFYEIVTWDDINFDIKNRRASKKTTITSSVQQLIMEGMLRKDIKNKNLSTEEVLSELKNDIEYSNESLLELREDNSIKESHYTKEKDMSAQEKLKVLAEVDGFEGAGLYTPTGEALAMVKNGTSDFKLEQVGVLANNVLLNAQKAAKEMGVGRGQVIHVMADKAHFIVRCLNEGDDPLKSSPGKAHIHLVLVLKDESSIGLAKMRIESVINTLAEDFR